MASLIFFLSLFSISLGWRMPNSTDGPAANINDITSDIMEIDNTFKLLAEGDKTIHLSEQYKNITLVIGNTGAGKSTFVQWLAGDDSNLVSKDVGEDTGDFIIEDGNRISSSTINSKTTFPELVVDLKTNAAYYDCPGFSDTRSTSYDIAATYFIKKLTEHASNIKIVLVVGYPAVRKGVDRQEFIQLMRHTTDLIKNINRFQNSIAIGVTKVDNAYKKTGQSYTLVPDEDVIQNIANFMQSVKEDLNSKLKATNNSSKEKEFCAEAINLIDALLQKRSNEYYRKIVIFRRPDEPGPLSNITLLRQGKNNVEKILSREIEFAQKSNNDFGYTISERSKNDINILVERINELVWSDVSTITDNIKEYYKNLTEEMGGKINYFLNSTEIVPTSNTEAYGFLTKINKGNLTIANLWAESRDIISIEDLANSTNSSLADLGISTCTNNIERISEQGKYFNFLQVVSNRKLNMLPWVDLFERIPVYLHNLKKDLDENILIISEKIEVKIKLIIENIAKLIEENYLNKMDSLEIHLLLTDLNKGFNLISDLIEEISHSRSAQELSKKITNSEINSDLSISSIIVEDTSNIFYLAKYLEFLSHLNNQKLDNWSSEWIIPFNNIKTFLNESEKWYIFLNDLYDKFSELNIQKDVSRYNVENIDDWGVHGKSQGIQITENNFGNFLEKIKEYEIKEFSSIKDITVTLQKLKSLNDVLRLTLHHKIDKECSEPGELVLKGNFIRFSDFTDNNGKILDLCGNGVKLVSVRIFSLNTVFSDRDIQEVGSKLQLTIISPKWQIIGNRSINLDGSPGLTYNSTASSGNCPGADGEDGHPGYPGGGAGNFVGIGNTFIDSRYLTISASGGAGGSGQLGGNGAQGTPGLNATTDGSFESSKVRDDKLILVLANSVIDQYLFYGKAGGSGGNGGNGGSGGLGGPAGKVSLFQFNKSSDSPPVKNTPGSVGTGGTGGLRGLSGRHGNDLKAAKCKMLFLFIPLKKNWCSEVPVRSNSNDGHPGQKGIDGGNSKGIQLPEQAKEFQNIANIVNNYKSYLREIIKNRFTERSLTIFFGQLDSNVNIKDSYNTLELVSELHGIEAQYHSLHKNVDFLPFYKSLLNRTDEYAQHPKDFENSAPHKRVLSYLYTAILSRISALKKESETNLIIDLDNYLTLVKRNIDSLSNLQENANKINVIQQYKETYKISIDTKISEAELLIATQVTPEINNINTQIEHNIDCLINETIELQQQAKVEKELLVKKKRELELAITARWLLGSISILSETIGCFSTVGTVVGSVIDLTSQVAESLSLEGPNSYNALELPDGIASTIQSIQELTNKTSMLKNVDNIGKQAGTVGFDIYRKYKDDKKQIDTINEAIEQASDKIQKLEQYESQIYEKINPMFKNVVNDLNNISNQVSNKSLVVLDVTQWQVQSVLRDIKLQMKQFTKGFTMEDNLARCFEKLEETMTTLINIYDLIENYHDKQQLAIYIADISSTTVSHTDTSNQALNNAINQLEIVIRSNLVIEQYQTAVNALKQQVFPFAQLYLDGTGLPSHLQSASDFQGLVSKAVTQVEDIQSKMDAYKTAIERVDAYLSSGWFTRDYISAQPFFVWKNSEYRNEILKLLSGDKVVFKANILNSPFGKDAIKFNKIGINFYSENSTMTAELNNILKGFEVTATHLGNSYYRYNNNIYITTSGNQNFQFSFEKDVHGEPVHYNKVYEKIKSGDLMLSPYAMWEIQLTNVANKINFRDLTEYKDKVNLELVGHGVYVTGGHSISDLNIESHYKMAETISADTLSELNQQENPIGNDTDINEKD